MNAHEATSLINEGVLWFLIGCAALFVALVPAELHRMWTVSRIKQKLIEKWIRFWAKDAGAALCVAGLHDFVPAFGNGPTHIDRCSRCNMPRSYDLFNGTGAWRKRLEEEKEAVRKYGHRTGYRPGMYVLERRYRMWCCPHCYSIHGPGDLLHTFHDCWGIEHRRCDDASAPKVWYGMDRFGRAVDKNCKPVLIKKDEAQGGAER